MSRVTVLTTALVLAGTAAVAQIAAAESPSIEGSYTLVKRVLADGSEVTPPDVVGFMTFTGEYRNFNVRWGSADNPTSVSYVCKYTLSDEEYCEEPLYWLQNNLGEPGLAYAAPAEKSECSQVSHEDGAVSFAIKGEPVVVRFEGETFTATAEGQFVDHWKRVE